MKKILFILFFTFLSSVAMESSTPALNNETMLISLEEAFQSAQQAKRRFGLDQNAIVLIEHKLTEKAAEGDLATINATQAEKIIFSESIKFLQKRNKRDQETIRQAQSQQDALLAQQLATQEPHFNTVDFQEQIILLQTFKQSKQEQQAKKDRQLAEKFAQEETDAQLAFILSQENNAHTNEPPTKKPELTRQQRRLQRQKKQNKPRNQTTTQKVQPQQSNQNGRIIVNGKQCRGLQWTVKIGNKNIPVKQVFVLPQSGTNGGGASCGYHALHNGIILKNANHNMATLLNTSRNFANEKQFILQERRQGIQNQRARARVHAQNLETFEIHQLCQRFHLNELRFDESGYSYTILDQAGSITTNNVENIMGESLDIVKVRLRQLQDYTHIFAVRIPGKKATHWFTVVVRKQNGQTEYLVADSAGNHRRVRDQMLITLIDELEK